MLGKTYLECGKPMVVLGDAVKAADRKWTPRPYETGTEAAGRLCLNLQIPEVALWRLRNLSGCPKLVLQGVVLRVVRSGTSYLAAAASMLSLL